MDLDAEEVVAVESVEADAEVVVAADEAEIIVSEDEAEEAEAVAEPEEVTAEAEAEADEPALAEVASHETEASEEESESVAD